MRQAHVVISTLEYGEIACYCAYWVGIIATRFSNDRSHNVQATPMNPGASPLIRSENRELKRVAREVRRDILLTTFTANAGHPGGSLSETEILISLYHRILRHDPKNPSWPDRDRFVLSKGHATPGFYAVLAARGYFPRKELNGFRRIDSLLQGHTKIGIPGVEMSAGSLGQGLSFSMGVALACRLDSRPSHTYVLLGDGECDEGQVWEAAMSAAHYKVDTLTAIVDRNGIQNDRFVSQVMEIEPLAAKWRGFGWRVHPGAGPQLSIPSEGLCTGPSDEGATNGNHRTHDEGEGRQLHGGQSGLPRQTAQ